MVTKKAVTKKAASAGTKKAWKYRKLTIKGGSGSQKDIAIYAGPKVHESFKVVSQELDVYNGFHHLFNLLDAALEEGKRLGRAEVMPKIIDMQKQFKKIVDGIEKGTNYKKPERPKKLISGK